MDFSVLADRDCLVAFAAVVLCSDRSVEAHKMGYDYGGIAHLTAKGAAGRTGLSQAASGRALRRLEEAGLIISNGDGDAWRTCAGIFAGGGDNASPEPGQGIVPGTAGAGTEMAGVLPGRRLPPPVAALMEQFGMTEADVLALAMSGPAEDFSIPDELYVGSRRVPRQKLPPLKKSAAMTVHTVKASLHGAKPPVWRRLELPSELTLDMVHEVVQIAFAWHGYHVYDFGDDWRHDIVVEKITPALPGVAYPRCTGGRGWAPEEDSGGIWAHNEAVAAAGPVMPFTPTALGALAEPT
jgi:Plasmid pRiA4b ORF-3-like protein